MESQHKGNTMKKTAKKRIRKYLDLGTTDAAKATFARDGSMTVWFYTGDKIKFLASDIAFLRRIKKLPTMSFNF